MAEQLDNAVTLIGLGSSRGHAVVNKHSPLRRLNYFDGKFIRAPDMILEQQALLNQTRLGNRAGGAGVVDGYDCTLAGGDALQIGAGFAIDPQGKVLLLADGISVGIAELIEKSTASPGLTLSAADSFSSERRADFDDCVIQTSAARVTATDINQLYLITVNHTEAYCGEEDVYGKLCSEACSTSTNRSYIIEGVEIRAVPIDLSQLYKTSSAVALSGAHLRSRVASAYYQQEQQRIASHISGNGLGSSIWCLGAEAAGGNGVPIAILGRNGDTTLFLDAWSARRERMESPPRHYWAYRMAMRPWAVYLAQIFQFQCQLRDCLTSNDPDAPCKKLKEFDPCYDTRKAAGEAASEMRYLLDSLSRVAGRLAEFDADSNLAELQSRSTALEARYQDLVDAARIVVPERLLINCGIVEVPSAGYLPVNVSSTLTVNEQVRRFFGEGVDLRFCVTRADFIPHALEEAQHMERICLLSGLDDPSQKPRVDVLVPDGEIQQLETAVLGSGYQSTTVLNRQLLAIGWPRRTAGAVLDERFSVARSASLGVDLPPLLGAARGEGLNDDGAAFYLGARAGSDLDPARVKSEVPSIAAWASISISRDPFALDSGASCDISARFLLVASQRSGERNVTSVMERRLSGKLLIEKSAPQQTTTKLTARLEASGLWRDVSTSNGQSNQRVEAVNLNDTLRIARRAVPGLPPTISITMDNPSLFAGLGNVQLIAERIWTSASQSTVRLLVRVQTPEAAFTHVSSNFSTTQHVLLECRLTEDDSVLRAGNSWHGYSLQALDSVEKITGEKGFSESAQQQLFPPPRPVAEELRVLARRDWVLFHRRREKTCAVEVAPEAVAVVRRYRVYHVHLDDDIGLERLLTALQQDPSGALAGLDPRPVTTVVFSPGIASVATAHGDVRADWQARVQVTADIQLALIASEGDVLSEGIPLADSRLQSLTTVLAPVSELADDYQTLNLSEVPSNLAGAEVDGAVVYFTRAAAAVCHTVYRLVTRELANLLETLNELFSGTDLTLAEIMKQAGGQELLKPRFIQGTADYYGSKDAEQLATAWEVTGDGPVANAIALGSDDSDQGQSLTRQQATRIGQTVDSDFTSEILGNYVVGASRLGRCPKATVLIAALECNDVVEYRFGDGDLGQIIDPLIRSIQDGLSPQDIDGKVLVPLLAVDFYRNSDRFEDASRDAFKDKWLNRLNGIPPSSLNAALLAVARKGTTGTGTEINRQLAEQQAFALREFMGLDHVEVHVVTNGAASDGDDVDFPVDCQALTLLVLGASQANDRRSDVVAVAIREPTSGVGLTREGASDLRFDASNAVIRDEVFKATVERLRANPITTIEVVSIDGSADRTTEARANALLEALRDADAARDGASVTVRAADERERVEIVRSGLALNNGLVLRS